jgi:hypothetical protein
VIEIDFASFYGQEYADEGYDLYVMKNGIGSVLYIGISRRSIWERWFGFGGHILWADHGIEGKSAVGQKIVDHLPESLQWIIQLWTLEDCVNFCKDEYPIPAIPNIGFIEPLMINKLSPILNGSYNLYPGYDTTSTSKKEIEREKLLDEVYKKIFDKKDQ